MKKSTTKKAAKAAPLDFLSIASHQLRAPLTLMKGYLSMILEGEFGAIKDKKLKAAIEAVKQSNERLAHLVENLLEMARLEEGAFTLFREEADLAAVILSVADELRSKAKAKGLRLEISLPKEKIVVSIDRLMMRQLFLNLIDNAIKYTAKGGVMIALERRGRKLVASVSDTGPGLLQKGELKRLFQKFSRPNDDPSGQSGFGLGLYICRLIVEAHGGKIKAELPKSGGLKVSFAL